MGRLLKLFAYFLAAVVGLFVVTIVAVMILFDVNDYREDIETVVQKNTGREFTIDGEIGMAVFPWVEIEMPPLRLGNAAGFGDLPMASIDELNLRVRLLPLLLRREVEVSTAELIGLQLNLAVNAEGRSNWQDFIDAAEYKESMPAEETVAGDTALASLEIAGIDILNSKIAYADATTDTNIVLNDLNLEVGDISGDNDSIRLDGFAIEALLEGLSTTPTVLGLETAALGIDTNEETIALGEIDLELLGLDISADVEPFSYAAEIAPVAKIVVEPFSLRNLMQRLDIEAPPTTDPAALGKVEIAATARVTAEAIALNDLTLGLDETRFTGTLSIPQGSNDVFELELHGDAIVLDGYMAPVVEGEASAAGDDAAVEIPVELLRLLNARGELTLTKAELSGMQFENLELGVALDDGSLRLHPMKADLFAGQYNGDVRIDASGDTPVMSVNERIEGVQLGALAKAMFAQDNISGTINGSFELRGRGADLAAIQRDLDGNIALALADGAYEGADVWHELRKARALLRQEAPPEPNLPARTRFSEVSVSGPVTKGVFSSDNFIAELPFMQLTGNGSVSFAAGTVDYRMSARVFEKPEFIGEDVTADELEDLSKTKIPIRITGPIVDPSVKPDVEKLLQDRVKQEVEDVLKDKLKDLLNR